MDPCVFCHREAQAATLFETDRLFVIPDKYPLVPGHTLIVTKEHLACYGAAPTEVFAEVEEAARQVELFLNETYSQAVLFWENGVSGQSVFHAHLHAIPIGTTTLPPEFEQHPDVAPFSGWNLVQDTFARDGSYRFLGMGNARWIVPGYSSVLRLTHQVVANATGLRHNRDGWIKTTTSDDVLGLERRWQAWIARRVQTPPTDEYPASPVEAAQGRSGDELTTGSMRASRVFSRKPSKKSGSIWLS